MAEAWTSKRQQETCKIKHKQRWARASKSKQGHLNESGLAPLRFARFSMEVRNWRTFATKNAQSWIVLGWILGSISVHFRTSGSPWDPLGNLNANSLSCGLTGEGFWLDLGVHVEPLGHTFLCFFATLFQRWFWNSFGAGFSSILGDFWDNLLTYFWWNC